MSIRLMILLMLLAGAGCRDDAPATEDAPAEPPLERIVFFGDSITQAGVEPGGYVSLVADSLANVPGRRFEVIGAGISGNKVPDLLARVDRDVLAHEPTHVVIYIGINDVWHWFEFDPEGTERDVYEQGLRTLVDTIRAAGAEVTLCTPSVIGEAPEFASEEDEMLDDYADLSRTVAAETGAELCDLRAAFKSHLVVHNPDGRAEGVLTTDGVHLNAGGNRFVADRMLEAVLE